jgi:short subunit dehydrogenase-like uncharacterized protein|tara:strand:+ start:22 stop:1281 length:1260 start_codon:yes stop_codon:yes gene_type:complete
MCKRFQVTLLGATGITGRNAFDYIAENGHSNLKWNIAGRSEEKLNQILERAEDNWNKPEITVVDITDREQVKAMIKDSQVLIHLAGPYATHGEFIISQCIAHRTDYVDIGGETFFIREMILKYHDAAKARGVRIIPTAGYESLPFDILTTLAIKKMREDYGEKCASVKIVTSFLRSGTIRDNRISGGSIGTMRNILDGDSIDAFNDMSCLLPEECDRKAIRRRNKVRYKSSYDDDVQAYTGPLQPAPFLNVPVILRTAYLRANLGYSDKFSYSDSMTMEFYSKSEKGQRKAALQSAIVNRLTSSIMAGPKIFRFLIRRRLDAMGIKPGDGPSEESLPFIDYELRLFAISESGERLSGKAIAKGHPGYLSTAKIAAEAGLALSLDTIQDDQQFGVVTPSVGLGISFTERLKKAGVSFSFD